MLNEWGIIVKKRSKQERYEIITHGIKFGVTQACKDYGISRTIYYRWLKRVEAYGINGLEEIKRNYTPKNKASHEFEKVVLNKIRMYPEYGPRSIAWILEDHGFTISDSGVFNIMKRHHLTTKKDRVAFCKQHDEADGSEDKIHLPLPQDTKVGDIWLCWTDYLGNIDKAGDIYQYCIIDVKSKIACSRIFRSQSTEYALDTLLGVAFPMGKDLNMKPQIIMTHNVQDYTTGRNKGGHRYTTILRKLGIKHILWSEKYVAYTDIAQGFSEKSLSFLKHKILVEELNFSDLKDMLQNFLREYNLQNPVDDPLGRGKTPFEIVVSESKEEILLPVWVYINRSY